MEVKFTARAVDWLLQIYIIIQAPQSHLTVPPSPTLLTHTPTPISPIIAVSPIQKYVV